MTQHKDQRVGVFVDVQNMYYSAKQLYGEKVNFTNILKAAVEGRRLIRAFCYVIKADVKDEKNFHDALEMIGYEVKVKDLQIFYGGAKKGDWDIGIAMDIAAMCPKLDVVVLVSGDGDFKECIEYVKARGCRAEVMSFEKTASSKLKIVADRFYDFEKNLSKFIIKGSISKKPHMMQGAGAHPGAAPQVNNPFPAAVAPGTLGGPHGSSALSVPPAAGKSGITPVPDVDDSNMIPIEMPSPPKSQVVPVPSGGNKAVDVQRPPMLGRGPRPRRPGHSFQRRAGSGSFGYGVTRKTKEEMQR